MGLEEDKLSKQIESWENSGLVMGFISPFLLCIEFAWKMSASLFFSESKEVKPQGTKTNWSRKYFSFTYLSATLAKSGPLDFPSEKSFLLFFAHEKGLGHMFQK